MSWDFDIGNQTIWSPSKNIGQYFLSNVKELELIVDEPSGLIEVMSDTVDIDVAKLCHFVAALSSPSKMKNETLRLLSEGCLIVLFAMAIHANPGNRELLGQQSDDCVNKAITFASQQFECLPNTTS